MANSTSAHASEGTSQLHPAPIDIPYPTTDYGLAEGDIKKPHSCTTSEASNKPSISEFATPEENDKRKSEAPFRFMALPKDLRIAIYELVCQQFLHDIPLRELPITGRSPYQDVWQSNLRSLFKEMLALLYTSRTLRDEGIKVYRRIAGRGLQDQEEIYERHLDEVERTPIDFDKIISGYTASSEQVVACTTWRACAADVRRIRALLEQVYEEHDRIKDEAEQVGEDQM